MIGLTQAQAELLHFIKSYMAENNGVSPSFEEMKEELGLKSKSGVHRLISALVERGFIQRLPNRARALEVVEKPTDLPPLSHFPTDVLIAELARRSEANRRAA